MNSECRTKLADQHFASLFWSVGALFVAPIFVDFIAGLHSQISPQGAERLWTPWWDSEHPHALTYWGAVVIATFLVMRTWMISSDIWHCVAFRGKLYPKLIALIAALLFVDWTVSGVIEAIAEIVTGQSEIPAYRPGYEYQVTMENLFADLFSGVIAAPIFEEFAFRGLFLGCLLARGWSAASAILFTSFVFGLTHTQYYPSGMIMVMFSGCVFGFLRVHTGGLTAPIIAHGALNLSITISELLFPETA